MARQPCRLGRKRCEIDFVAAFTLISQTQSTVSSPRVLFGFLSDFKNFASILPDDKVENFTYNGDQCSFSIRGITPMTVRLVEKQAYHYILFSSEGLARFNFSLKVHFTGDAETPGQCSVHLSGDLNPVIVNMAKNSLEALANTMALKLSKLEIHAD